MSPLDLLGKMISRHRDLRTYLGEERFARLIEGAITDVKAERAENEVLGSLALARRADAAASKAKTYQERQYHELKAQLYAVVPVELMHREEAKP